MGAVYLAEDRLLGREVAIKFESSPSDGADTVSDSDDLLEEARRSARLRHPNLPAVYDVGRENGYTFLVMEYIKGRTVRAMLDDGPPPLEESLRIGQDLAGALAAIHDLGLIHGDVSADNAIIRTDGTVFLVDLGLSRTWPESATAAPRMAMDELEAGRLPVEAISGINGTLEYLAPEQLTGHGADAQTDIYSFGVLLFELITGKKPFADPSPTVLARMILHEDPPPLGNFRPDIPLSLEQVLRKALAKSSQRRYGRAMDLHIALKGLIQPTSDSRGEEPSETGKYEFGERWHSRRKLWRDWLLSFGALLSVSGGGWLFFSLMMDGRGTGVAFLAATIGAGCLIAGRKLRVPDWIGDEPGTDRLAFRGLSSYQEADRNLFFGRDADIRAAIQMALDPGFRFGILMGESGCGKTSLLRAGVIPVLREHRILPVYCRAHGDLIQSIENECQRQSQIGREQGELSAEYFCRLAREMNASLLVVCDQFEEFFTHFPRPEDRVQFRDLVFDLYSREDCPVGFLFSIRNDFLYLVHADFAQGIPDPLASSRIIHLKPFTEKQAENIIRWSIARAGWTVEEGFCRSLAGDLAQDGIVLPSELQIVGDQLQKRRLFSIAEYRKFGGKEALVHGYLSDIIRVSGDDQAAALLLRALISEENTRLTLDAHEIARRIQRNPETTGHLLALFARAHVIREIQEEDPWRYELMHEYLIHEINRITGKVMDARQQANRLLRQYVSNYQLDPGTRIPLKKLWFVRRYGACTGGAVETELMRKSYWRSVAGACGALTGIIGLTILLAAGMSIQEEWVSQTLRYGHTAAVRRVSFTPAGDRLLSAGEDTRLIMWDFQRRIALDSLATNSGWITCLAVTPEGRHCVTGGSDARVRVWQITNGFVLEKEWKQETATLGLGVSGDGRWLISVDTRPDSGWTEIRDTKSWEVRGGFPVTCSSVVDGVQFRPGSDDLMTNSGEMWTLFRGPVASQPPFPPGNHGSFSPDGSLYVSIESLGRIHWVDALSGGSALITDAHEDHGRAVAFSPDGRWLATGAEDILLWNSRNGERLGRFQHAGNVWDLEFSPDGRWLVSGHGDGAILQWDVENRRLAANFNEHSGPVRAVAFSSDGKQVASGSDDGSIIIWDWPSGLKKTVFLGHRYRVTGLAFHPDGGSLFSSDFQKTALRWNLPDPGAPPERLEDNPRYFPSEAFAMCRDGRWVANSGGVYDTDSGEFIVWFDMSTDNRRFIEDARSLYGLAFSPDARLLAGVNHYGSILVIDSTAWETRASRNYPDMSLITVDFAPDGRRLVTGDDSGGIWLWTVDPLEPLEKLGQHEARIKAVRFSPDGKMVASAGDDQVIAFWEAGRPNLVARLRVHTAPVLSIAFSPDGRNLVSGGQDGTVRVHTLERSLWGYPLY